MRRVEGRRGGGRGKAKCNRIRALTERLNHPAPRELPKKGEHVDENGERDGRVRSAHGRTPINKRLQLAASSWRRYEVKDVSSHRCRRLQLLMCGRTRHGLAEVRRPQFLRRGSVNTEPSWTHVDTSVEASPGRPKTPHGPHHDRSSRHGPHHARPSRCAESDARIPTSHKTRRKISFAVDCGRVVVGRRRCCRRCRRSSV